jgi:hypothetical protein
MLVFPLAQAQMHIKQNNSTWGGSQCVLYFHLAQAQAHPDQHHSMVEES